MKRNTLASLFFLSIMIVVLFNNCNKSAKSISISSEVVKKIDSLNILYTIASKNSNSEDKRTEAIISFLDQTKKLEIDSLYYKGLFLQAKLLNKYNGPQKAIDLSYSILEHAQYNNDSVHIGRALYRLGYYNKMKDNYLEAFNYYNQSFKIRRDVKDSINAGRCLMAMSNVERTLGDFNASKTTATDGLKYLRNSFEYRIISGLYHGIAISFYELGNQEEALLWNSKVLGLFNFPIAKKKIGVHNLPIFKNFKANILAEQKKYEESVRILQLLLKEDSVLQKRKQYAQILSNLGYIKFLQNSKNVESETMLLKALSIRQQEKDLFGLFHSNIHLTKYYRKTDLERAKYHAHKAYEHIKDFNDYEALLEVLTLITELDPDSLEEHHRFKEVSLKLMQLRKKTREIYAPTRFENENLLKENEIKNRRISQVRNQNTIYLLGILLLFISIVFAVYFFRQRTRYLAQQNKIVEFQASYETETRISKRLHDELGNDIFQVMLQYQNDPHDPRIKNKLNHAYAKARDISRENNEFDIGETFSEELNNMLQNYAYNGIRLIAIGFDNIDWNHLDKTVKITIYRVLQELMTNMQKHSKANLVKLMFSCVKDTIKIKYSDNGVGMKQDHLKSKNGLRNTEKRVKAINGTLIFDSEKDKGFKAEIEIPNQ